jgi:cytochrome c
MRRALLIVGLTTVACSLNACGQSETGAISGDGTRATALTAATLGEQTVLSPDEYLGQEPYALADSSRGEALAMQCRACHTLDKGGATIVGPNLFGIFSRMSGSDPDFPYSNALAAAGFVWTPRALDAWLAEPFAFLPGNRMSFPGMPDDMDRNALIAYLLRYTQSSEQDDTGVADAQLQD